MRTILFAGIAIATIGATSALADSPWDGTWKADVNSAQMPKKPDMYLLKDGTFTCKTCGPAYTVKADGMDHPVSGHPYFDSAAVKVVDDHTVQETDKKNGKAVTTSTNTVSPDGKTMTFEFSDSSNTNAAPVTGKGTQTRVGAMPAGAHPMSGSWRTTSFQTVSDNGLTVTYKVDGDTLTMTSPTGQKYTAKMDGADAAMSGDPGITTVSVRKLANNTIEETDKRGGKVVGIAKMTLAADGKKMHVVYQNKLRGTTMSYEQDKQ